MQGDATKHMRRQRLHKGVEGYEANEDTLGFPMKFVSTSSYDNNVKGSMISTLSCAFHSHILVMLKKKDEMSLPEFYHAIYPRGTRDWEREKLENDSEFASSLWPV